MARILLVFGAVLVVFTFLAAFTIYGEIALLLGLGCIATGAWMTSRRLR